MNAPLILSGIIDLFYSYVTFKLFYKKVDGGAIFIWMMASGIIFIVVGIYE
jgi:hypothetical membrane protein